MHFWIGVFMHFWIGELYVGVNQEAKRSLNRG